MTLKEAKSKYEIVDRITSDIPDFWKQVRFYSLIVFGVATAATTTIATMGIDVPLWVTIIMSISGTLSGAAQLTKKS